MAQKTLLAFNPDTMRVDDCKLAVKALRSLLDRADMLRGIYSAEDPEQHAKMAEDMYLQIVQLEQIFTTNDEEEA